MTSYWLTPNVSSLEFILFFMSDDERGDTLNFVPLFFLHWVRANRMSLSCSFILSRIDLPVSPMYTLPHSNGILQTTPFCFVDSRASLGRTKWDLSIVSDLKTVRIPSCCRQRRRENGNRFKFLRGFFCWLLLLLSLRVFVQMKRDNH